MDSRAKYRNSETSLCERSMKVVTNIIRNSSFSIAQRTLGLGATGHKGSKEALLEEDMVPEKEPMPMPRGSRRSQEPQNRPNPTYVLKPRGRDDAEADSMSHRHVIHREECVDGLASDYIKKIRNQIGCGL